MDNVLIIPPGDFAKFITSLTQDENGNYVSSGDGANAMVHVVSLALRRKSKRKPRVDLSDPKVLSEYEGKLTALLKQNMVEVANGGRLISERKAAKELGLGKDSIGKNDALSNIYQTYKRSMSNAAPTTLDNDADADWDEDID